MNFRYFHFPPVQRPPWAPPLVPLAWPDGLLEPYPAPTVRVHKSVILRMLNPQPGDRWEESPAWSTDRGFWAN